MTFQTPRGRRYVLGVDMRLDELQRRMRRNLLVPILGGAAMLVVSLALPFGAAAGANTVQSPEHHASEARHSDHGDWSWDDWMSAFADFFAGPETREEFRWQGTLAKGATLEIKGINGKISAEPAAGNGVELVALKHGRRNDPKQVEIAVVEHAGGVTPK